jgi:hypothetical protein
VSVGNLTAIAPPPVKPGGYNLLTALEVDPSADVPAGDEQPDAEPWQQGIRWAPEAVAAGAANELDCMGRTPGREVPGANAIENKAEPFVVDAADRCSTFGWKARDYEGRARRQLASMQSFLIARELQLGALRDDQSLENVALKDGTAVDAGALEAHQALGALEFAMGGLYAGRAGVVHVDQYVFDLLRNNNLLIQSGQRWLSPNGNVIAADAGYRLEDGDHMMYGTLPVIVRLSPVMLVPGTLESARSQATNLATNLTTIWSERLALVQFDNSNATLADLILKQAVLVDSPVS